ncbi:MAG: hypothetical protein J5756_01865 [Clostridia bacterium]|nr:hypothetical protein [Clostridia bacterium]
MDKNQKIQCHFIPNTHWDREWRYSARRTQFMLGQMLDLLFDILEKNPEYKHFHLDSQTMPVQDYLEVYPEKKEKFQKYVREGRIAIGPWFCLPDEFCVGGESLIRNLLLGHKIGKEMGAVSKTGYSPFGWGQISQMPQIYSGFGIRFASFYRGLNPYVAPKSEFFWEGADGTRIYASRLATRPRYNVWYVVHRPVYFNVEDVNNRIFKWDSVNGVFKFIDAERHPMDMQYTHPFYKYFAERVEGAGKAALKEQDGEWTTNHRFWSESHDSSFPDAREVRMVKDLNDKLPECDVFFSSLKEFEDAVIENFDPKSTLIKGEMRRPATKGSVSPLMGWVCSARMYIKQSNFRTERDLTYYAEPLAVFAALCGAAYPKNFIALAYNYLLQNHGHDSIGACSRDVVADDVMARFKQSREISSCVYERAFIDVAGDIKLEGIGEDDSAIVVYNPAPFKRTEVVEARVELRPNPKSDKNQAFHIYDEDGKELPYQLISTNRKNEQVVQFMHDSPNVIPTEQYEIRLLVSDVPAMGYKTLKLVTVKGGERKHTPETMLTSPTTMENEYLAVSMSPNGTFNVLNKENGREYKGLGFFKDSSEIANPWEHFTVEQEEVFTTLTESPRISVYRSGKLETAFRVTLDWMLPESRAEGDKKRSPHFVPVSIDSIITLHKGAKYVSIETTVDNRAEDHYLQVGFPTGIVTDDVYVQGQFDIVKRQVAKLDYSLYDEEPMTEHPMNSFVTMNDGKDGVALLNFGLKAYEVDDADKDRTMYLTLLRAFPLRICVCSMQDYSQIDKGSQCLGKHTFKYAFYPFTGDHDKAKVWQMSERFTLDLSLAQIAPKDGGKNPMTHSFLELKDENLNVSAVKQSEDGEGYVVRLFNYSDKTIKNAIRLNKGRAPIETPQSPCEREAAEWYLPPYDGATWGKCSVVTLEELPESELSIGKDGFVDFEIAPKKILTLKFVR